MKLNLYQRIMMVFLLVIVSVTFALPRVNCPGRIAVSTDFSDLMKKVEPFLQDQQPGAFELPDIQVPEKVKLIPLFVNSFSFESSLTCVLLKSQNISLPPPVSILG